MNTTDKILESISDEENNKRIHNDEIDSWINETDETTMEIITKDNPFRMNTDYKKNSFPS